MTTITSESASTATRTARKGRFYFAFLRDEDYPCQVVTATITERMVDFPPYLDWIETGQEHRRKGLATELLRAIETHLGEEIIADGATEAGIGFCEAMERKNG